MVRHSRSVKPRGGGAHSGLGGARGRAAGHLRGAGVLDPRVQAAWAPAAAARAAAMAAVPMFVMLGHGSEKLVDPEDRPILPADTILVTAVECSISSPLHFPQVLLRYLHEHPEHAADPIRFKSEIERRVRFGIRIYKSGDRYPNLLYNPYAIQKSSKTVYLSGVVPLKRVTTGDVRLMDAGLVYPGAEDDNALIEMSFGISETPSVADVIANKDILSEFKSVTEIIETLGPGVYYFPLCRDVAEGSDPARIELVRSYSTGIQRTRGAKRSTKGYRTRRNRRKSASPGGKKVRTQKRRLAPPTTRRRTIKFAY
jgi:hypothetical protein